MLRMRKKKRYRTAVITLVKWMSSITMPRSFSPGHKKHATEDRWTEYTLAATRILSGDHPSRTLITYSPWGCRLRSKSDSRISVLLTMLASSMQYTHTHVCTLATIPTDMCWMTCTMFITARKRIRHKVTSLLRSGVGPYADTSDIY